MISKEKWAEIKLNWQRYKVEYIGTIVIILLVLLGFWFLVLKPAIDEDHNETLVELKTKLLQNIKDNSATLEFSNENEAVEAKSNLEEISRNDNIHFRNIKLSKNGEKTEIKVQFKSAK